MIIDAERKVLGRLASDVAQRLQDGEEVRIINAEKAVVSGDREDVFERYRAKRERGSRDRGPFYPQEPGRIMKRTVRGMLPKNNEGREQLKRLRTYQGNPDGIESEDVDVSSGDDLKNRNYVTLKEIADNI